MYPNQTISMSPNSHLCRLFARISSYSLFCVLMVSFSCCSSVPFVIIMISSKNAFVEFSLFNVVFTIFWNVAGRSVNQ